MSNDLLGQILSSVLGGQGEQPGAAGGGGLGGLGGLLGGGMSGSAPQDGLGGFLGGLGGVGGGPGASGAAQLGGLGALLGGLGGGAGNDSNADAQGGSGGLGGMLGGKGPALAALLIPLAMQWVQRNGGIGAVVDRFKQQGYGQQASSWVSSGQNEQPPAQAVKDVVGEDDLSAMSQQLGLSHDEVAGGMAQVLPRLVDHLTPQGQVQGESDDRLNQGLSAFEQLARSVR